MAALYWTKLSIALQDMRCCNEVRALLINELKALYEIDSTIISVRIFIGFVIFISKIGYFLMKIFSTCGTS